MPAGDPCSSTSGSGSSRAATATSALDPSGRVDATQDALKVLSAAERSGERFGAAHLVDILRGSETEKIVRFGHRRLPAFGAGADRGKNEWRSMIRQMVATGFLRLDIAGYGGLGISGRGRALLRGEGEFLFREDRVIASSAARDTLSRAGTAEPAQPLDGDETALLNTLKALRLELARERGVPAYVVFPDRTLVDMARRRPRTEVEFAEVHGVGAAKLKQFAEPFLAAIENAVRAT